MYNVFRGAYNDMKTVYGFLCKNVEVIHSRLLGENPF